MLGFWFVFLMYMWSVYMNTYMYVYVRWLYPRRDFYLIYSFFLSL